MKTASSNARFSEPIYTIAEAARFLGVPPPTMATWARGYVRHPAGRPVVRGAAVIASKEARPNFTTIPFIGLAEGMVVAAFRQGGVSLQHIRRAVSVLEQEIRLDHALASERLYTDGAVILYDFAEASDEQLAGL